MKAIVNRDSMRRSFARYAPILLFILIILQPVLDIAAYWFETIGYTEVVPITRLLIFSGIFAVSYFAAEKRGWYWLIITIVLLFWAARSAVLLANGGIDNIYSDTATYARFVGTPLLAMALITFLSLGNKQVWMMALKAIFVNLCIIGLVVALSHMTNSVNYAYEATKQGTVGWFSNDNGQGIILVAITAFALLYGFVKKSSVLYIIASLLGFTLLFMHGSRVTYFSIFAIAITWMIILTIAKVRSFSFYLPLVTAVIIGAALYYQSPMHLNRAELAANNSRAATEVAEDNQLPPSIPSTNTAQNNTANQDSLYKKYNPELVDRFGEERVSAAYEYTSELSTIRDHRVQKNIYAKLITEDNGTGKIFFGNEYSDFVHNSKDFEPETDFTTVPFLYGIVGAAIYWMSFTFLIIYSIIQLVRYGNFTATATIPLFSIVLLLFAGGVGGHVALRLNVSFYIALSLAILVSRAKYIAAEDKDKKQLGKIKI